MLRVNTKKTIRLERVDMGAFRAAARSISRVQQMCWLSQREFIVAEAIGWECLIAL